MPIPQGICKAKDQAIESMAAPAETIPSCGSEKGKNRNVAGKTEAEVR
jgi:hypothetical protein